MSKGFKIVIVIVILAAIATGGIVYFKNKHTQDIDNQVQQDSGQGSWGAFNTSPSAQTSNTATPVTNVSASTTTVATPTQNQSYYSQAYILSLVPDNIKDSVNAFSADQWNQIVAKVNTLSGAKFSELQTQLQNIGWLDSLAINALSTQTLFNEAMDKINNI